MKYIQVKWNHEFPNDPIWLYSELDEKGWEVRKIEIFLDGSIGHADSNETTGSTQLSVEPLPSLVEIAADPQFEPVEISKKQFEEIWAKRKI